MTALSVVDGATPVSSLSYGYSDGINLTAVNDNVTPANAASLGYSATNRLITANGPWGQAAYSYDATGNRLTDVVTLAGSTTTRLASYGTTTNRITGMTENGASLRSYTYDGNGNILTDTRPGEVFAFSYNVRNRPVSVTRNSVAYANYAYNALEQLVSRATAAPGGPSGTIHYIYDLAGHLIAEADGSTGAITREYLWMDDLPIGLVQGGNLYMVHTDHLARPIRVTDASKATVWQATWGPWGEPQAISGTLALDMRFPGQLFQIETGLHYNWYRHYDPVTGRYTQPDPLRFVDGPSVYAYAGSSPAMAIDPTGLLEGDEGYWQRYLHNLDTRRKALRSIRRDIRKNRNPLKTSTKIFAYSATLAAACVIDVFFDTNTDPPAPDNDNCKPPAGTKCYQDPPDTSHDHAGLQPHYHIFQMQTYKKNGEKICQWKYLGGKVGVGVLDKPDAGMQPCSSYPNFSGRP